MTATDGGKAEALEREQFAAHGLAWYATYAAGLRQMLGWAERLETSGSFGEIERLILQAAFGEYLAQMAGGLAMSQGEIARPADLGIEDAAAHFAGDPAAARLIREGNTDALPPAPGDADGRRRLRRARAGATSPSSLVRDQFHRFAEDHREAAHRWHREDVLIPLEVVEELAGARRLRPHRAGGLWRARPRQARHVRGDGGALPRLYRPGLAGHAIGDRRRADPPRRHRGAEAALAARSRHRGESCPPPSSPSPAPAPTSAA